MHDNIKVLHNNIKDLHNNNNLKELLEIYKNLTEKIITSIEHEELEVMEELFLQREEIINQIDTLTYTKQQFINIAEEFNLKTLEEKLNSMYMKKKDDTYNEMQSNKEKMNANKIYTRNASRKISFLDQKI
ncbi:hypothetical protein SAMN05444401_1086 [Clostridium amylolyticum]|uniref:Flagellar protein FliT n=1 Tax=Clostridium amylolyticum TaxID=1121298 RepID=A0A1M6CDQ7_9CLOT|nr:hypothetical protein [Clostridium amylolyticum]SHI59023.1 hypothetical protein SAMN05444401_1086 [Clostridium amylolyticum]